MSGKYSELDESRLMGFIQHHYGLEVFTPGLARTRPIFQTYVELVQRLPIKVTIIAGTNGKGQTAHTLTHFLEAAGSRTALWTSPHILSLRERFRLRGEDVSYDQLERELYATHAFLQAQHLGTPISFYEFLFLLFLRLAIKEKGSEQERIDHLILEVGLGGRLDAVNHFDADCTCITSISRDHQAILGTRYDHILQEKIAVSRSGKPLFTQFRLHYLNSLTKQYCRENEVDWRPILGTSLSAGNYFEENVTMAREIFSFLEPLKELPEDDEIPRFKGRREEMTFKGNNFIFIGGHNIDGIRRMIELFSSSHASIFPSKVLAAFSKRSMNELEVMLKTLIDFYGKEATVLLTHFLHPKALELNENVELEKKILQNKKYNEGLLTFVTDWKNEITSAENQTFLVCGSYYFIGEVQRFILQDS